MNIIDALLALPLQAKIAIALVIATIIVLGSFLLGFIGDIILLALTIIVGIFLINFLMPIIWPAFSNL